jgi:predicted nucleotidyltransferase
MYEMFDFAQHREEIDHVCRKYGIARLEIFGSALRDDFAKDSDIDCLIAFNEKSEKLFAQYFDLKYELENLFDRSVDLVVEKALRNPYFKAELNETKQLVYAA